MSLRQKLGSSLLSNAQRASRMGALSTHVNANPDANHLTNNWLRRLGQTATTHEAREHHGQLTSILDFYNTERHGRENQPIEWDEYRERIHTEGVVDRIQAKYDKFMESEYSIDAAVSRVGVESEKIRALDTALQYNFQLYWLHWTEAMRTMETLLNIGDASAMSAMELASFIKGTPVIERMEREIGDFN